LDRSSTVTLIIVSLAKAFIKIPPLYKIWQCLKKFQEGFSAQEINSADEGQLQYLANWVKGRVLEALKSRGQAHPEDADALIAIAKEHDDKIFEEG
jgi:hypothetical protein